MNTQASTVLSGVTPVKDWRITPEPKRTTPLGWIRLFFLILLKDDWCTHIIYTLCLPTHSCHTCVCVCVCMCVLFVTNTTRRVVPLVSGVILQSFTGVIPLSTVDARVIVFNAWSRNVLAFNFSGAHGKLCGGSVLTSPRVKLTTFRSRGVCVCDALCVCDLCERYGGQFVKLHGSQRLVHRLDWVDVQVCVIVLEPGRAPFDLNLKHSAEGALLEALLRPCTPTNRQGTGRLFFFMVCLLWLWYDGVWICSTKVLCGVRRGSSLSPSFSLYTVFTLEQLSTQFML